MEPKLSEIKLASDRIKAVAINTPLIRSNYLSSIAGGEIFLKCENQQKTGSFKIRGAYNKISKIKDELNLKQQIIAVSAGNHAQGVAYAATACNFKSTIVMPTHAPLAKINATKGYGADVVLHGECFDEAKEYAEKLKGIFIHPYDDMDIIAGQGTIALEILDQIPDADIILVPAGGGGLLAGMAAGIKQINRKVKIIGVQAENANAIVQSFKSKKYICTETSSTLADGITVKNPGHLTIKIINKYVDEMISVTDHDIAFSVLGLMERNKLVSEPAGATTTAAILSEKLDFSNKKVVCLISGGNIDGSTISNILTRGLVAAYRKVELWIKAPENPNSAKEVINLIAETGSSILYLSIDRLSQECDIGYERIYVLCETNGKQHFEDIKNKLTNNGFTIQ